MDSHLILGVITSPIYLNAQNVPELASAFKLVTGSFFKTSILNSDACSMASIWPTLWNIPCALENVNSHAFGWSAPYMSLTGFVVKLSIPSLTVMG